MSARGHERLGDGDHTGLERRLGHGVEACQQPAGRLVVDHAGRHALGQAPALGLLATSGGRVVQRRRQAHPVDVIGLETAGACDVPRVLADGARVGRSCAARLQRSHRVVGALREPVPGDHAGVAGATQRGAGQAHKLVVGCGVFGERGHAAGDGDRVAVQRPCSEPAGQPPDQGRRRLGGHARQHQRKLALVQPADAVVAADAAREAAGRQPQHAVGLGGSMPRGVAGQPVQVDQRHRQALAGALGARQLTAEHALEAEVVGQARQRVERARLAGDAVPQARGLHRLRRDPGRDPGASQPARLGHPLGQQPTQHAPGADQRQQRAAVIGDRLKSRQLQPLGAVAREPGEAVSLLAEGVAGHGAGAQRRAGRVGRRRQDARQVEARLARGDQARQVALEARRLRHRRPPAACRPRPAPAPWCRCPVPSRYPAAR